MTVALVATRLWPALSGAKGGGKGGGDGGGGDGGGDGGGGLGGVDGGGGDGDGGGGDGGGGDGGGGVDGGEMSEVAPPVHGEAAPPGFAAVVKRPRRYDQPASQLLLPKAPLNPTRM